MDINFHFYLTFLLLLIDQFLIEDYQKTSQLVFCYIYFLECHLLQSFAFIKLLLKLVKSRFFFLYCLIDSLNCLHNNP